MVSGLIQSLAEAETNMERAQARQKEQTDKHRLDIEFEVGQQVLLSTADLRFKASGITPKLSARWIGPYRIKRKISSLAYELDLPPYLRLHPVFNVTKLKQYRTSEAFDPHRTIEPIRPPPELIDGNEEHEVEAIRDCRKRKYQGRLYKQYLVKWKGYPDYENTWEWVDSLDKAEELIEEYERHRSRSTRSNSNSG
jgi:hypothetical protein